ncbi:MAG: TRAP transporter fused permease subunit [Hyphomicrobiales bacterium]|nr:TRAP transporter fused permease subunit [Hyphomicrobiales bacterium]
MTEQQHVSAASEERFIATSAELAAAISRPAMIVSNVLKALLVAAVVLWVLDAPRQLLDLSFYTEQLLTVCLGLTLALAFLADTSRPRRFDDWLAAALSLLICGYITARYEALTYELAMLPWEGIIGSAVLTLLVLEASRRTSGWGFVGIILAIAVYVYISPFLPGAFQTRWVKPERMLVYVGLDVNGMIGSILGVAVLVVIPFTILGQVLARTGGAEFFSDLAMSAMGKFRGGAAKIAVAGSALFGMISGSAVSNVLAVGIVTIPTMIKSGFTPYRAAAIESVGSTGGQLMPPVMGAAAFIMAEFLQVSYGAVCVAAAIPAVLYYACLFIHVDLEAAKHGIGAVETKDAPALGEVIRAGWHFLIPIGFLVVALMYPETLRLTPEKAAVAATGLLIVLAMTRGYRGRRVSPLQIAMAVIETGRVSLDIILIGAAAGIMVGIMSISGLAFSMTLQLLALSGDNVLLLLLLIAVLAFVLGIGLPTVSVYILTATLLAPALVKLGVTPMAAHMFVMYNGMLSMITPPVAFAAYAAANIARTDGWTTGWIACVVGWSTFILPFLFVLTPSLLMDGPSYLIVWNLARILLALFVATAAIVGFALTPLTTAGRVLYGAVALPVMLPPEAMPGGYLINVIGIAAAVVLLAIDHLRRRKPAPAPAG